LIVFHHEPVSAASRQALRRMAVICKASIVTTQPVNTNAAISSSNSACSLAQAAQQGDRLLTGLARPAYFFVIHGNSFQPASCLAKLRGPTPQGDLDSGSLHSSPNALNSRL
jgi:hypothetical protein